MVGNVPINMIGMEAYDVMVTRSIEMAKERSKGKRKTRRGKKKRDGPYSTGNCVHGVDNCSDCCVNCVKNNSSIFNDKDRRESKRHRNSRQLRPSYSPKAPQNSTQFIMDDYFGSHDQSLYTSFDSPLKKMVSDNGNVSTISNTSADSDYGLDFLFRDNEIDFTDTVAYMEQDFESAYRDARIEKLSQMSKSDLLAAIMEMERKAEWMEKELEHSVSNSQSSKYVKDKCETGSTGALAKLKDENRRLITENDNIRKILDS